MIRNPLSSNSHLTTAFALEPRILFDGAAAATVDATVPADHHPADSNTDATLDQNTQSVVAAFSDIGSSAGTPGNSTATNTAGNLFTVAAVDAPSFSLADARQQAEQLIIAYASQSDAGQFFQIFNGNQSQAGNDWMQAAENLRQDILDGHYKT